MRAFSFLLVLPALWAVAAQDIENARALAGNMNAEHEAGRIAAIDTNEEIAPEAATGIIKRLRGDRRLGGSNGSGSKSKDSKGSKDSSDSKDHRRYHRNLAQAASRQLGYGGSDSKDSKDSKSSKDSKDHRRYHRNLAQAASRQLGYGGSDGKDSKDSKSSKDSK